MAKKRTVRMLHTGDIHLDSPFSRLRADKSEERRREMRETFARMLTYIREEAIDIALIAGDLFDCEYVTSATVKQLTDGFASCPDCRFFISPGNHDPYVRGGVYAAGRLPQNVHVFKDEALAAVDIPEWNVSVYGWAFLSERYEGAPLSGAKVSDSERLNLVCGHCEVGAPLSKYAALSEADVAAFAAHYAAFAHKHIPQPPKDAGGGALYAYCGCMEGRSFDEPGIGGAYLVVARPNETGYTIETERIEFARRRYEVAQVDLTGVDTQLETARRIKAVVKENGYGEETFLRAVFTGATPPGFAVPQEADGSALGLYALELVDKTVPTYDAAFLEKDLSVRGELYRYLLPRLTEGTAEERAAAARALRMGLAALEGNDITNM